MRYAALIARDNYATNSKEMLGILAHPLTGCLTCYKISHPTIAFHKVFNMKKVAKCEERNLENSQLHNNVFPFRIAELTSPGRLLLLFLLLLYLLLLLCLLRLL